MSEQAKRIRRRSAARQLQIALDAAQALDGQETNELTIARMKFMQARILTLNKVAGRQHSAKIRKLKEEVNRLRIENERLTTEVARLATTQASAHPTAIEINEALAKYGTKKESINVV
jgi:hypothetical protein